MVEHLTVVLGSGAYQSERAFTALRFVLTALVEGLKVDLFLVEDGIFVAKKGQHPTEFANVGELVTLALSEGASIVACGICTKERGVSEEDLLEGITMGTMHDLVAWVRRSDRTLFM